MFAVNQLPVVTGADIRNFAFPTQPRESISFKNTQPENLQPNVTITNYLCRFQIHNKTGETFSNRSALRIAVEHHPDGTFLASWVLDGSFTGYGETREEAVAELGNLFEHDFEFYSTLPEEKLTRETRAVKHVLLDLFTQVI
jgi:hypothetical protein